MSCRADQLNADHNVFTLDAGPTPFTGDADDYLQITTAGSDALFIDSLKVVQYTGEEEVALGSWAKKTWGSVNNRYGWCLSSDVNDDDWSMGATGKCYKTLLFAMNNQVYFWNQHLCIRPRWGCEGSDEIYHANYDCDGDGLMDHTCHSTTGSGKWVVLSSAGACTGSGYHGGGNWWSVGYSYCPAAFDDNNKDTINQDNHGYDRRIEGLPEVAPVDDDVELPAPANAVLGRLLEATQTGGATTPRPITPAATTPEPLSQDTQGDRQLGEAVLDRLEDF